MKTIILCIATMLYSLSTYAQTKATSDLLIERINQITLAPQPKNNSVVDEIINISERGEYVDASIKELFLCVDLPEDMMESYCQNFSTATGMWSDIDYADANRSGWGPGYHAMRLYSLSRAYYNPESKHYKSEELKSIIISAIDYWHRAKLVCPNWWYNQIGVPKLMGPVYLLFKNDLSKEQLNGAIEIMSCSKFGMTGQNKVALAGNVLMRALLEDDINLVANARDTIASEIYMGTGEGLQYDFSFHQHGPMMQFGNYGLAYIISMSYWGRVFSDTNLAFDNHKTALLSQYALQGMRHTIWRGQMDIAACGRQLFTNSPRGKVHALALAMINMEMVDPENKAQYSEFVSLNQDHPQGENKLIGGKMFWRSDYLINRAKDWYGSVRMSSDRTYGFEMTNSENLLGWYASDGVTFISVNGNEYTNIFPVWNWRELPGSTTQNNGEKLSTKYNFYSNIVDFVGGATSGNNSVATMQLNRDGLTAAKSYFFINNMMVCLGAGITSENTFPTTTSIEQSLLRSEVIYADNKGIHTLPKGDSIHTSNISWIHQNSVGYILLDKPTLNLTSRSQSRNWSEIATFYKNKPTSKEDIFKIVITHGNTPSNATYAYVVAPATTAGQTEKLAKNLGIKVVENSPQCQAVISSDNNTLEAVFHSPCTISTENLYFNVSHPGTYIVEKSKSGYTITISDPTQKLTKIQGSIGISESNATNFTTTLPSENMVGSSIVEIVKQK